MSRVKLPSVPGGAKSVGQPGLRRGAVGLEWGSLPAPHHELPEMLSPCAKRPLRDQEGGQAGEKYLGVPPTSAPVVTGTSDSH